MAKYRAPGNLMETDLGFLNAATTPRTKDACHRGTIAVLPPPMFALIGPNDACRQNRRHFTAVRSLVPLDLERRRFPGTGVSSVILPPPFAVPSRNITAIKDPCFALRDIMVHGDRPARGIKRTAWAAPTCWGGATVPVREPPEFRTASAELRGLSTRSYGSIFVADKHADRPSDHADVGNAMPLRIRRDM